MSDLEWRRLRGARPGDVLALPELLSQREAVPVVTVGIAAAPGPQFLLSDRPEYFLTGNGIALREDVRPGLVRLYLYHVPTPGAARHVISAWIENRGAAALSLQMQRAGTAPVGKDYLGIARSAMFQFLTAKPGPAVRPIPPGQRIALDERLEGQPAGADDLVHAIYEFRVNQPARITVLQRDAGIDVPSGFEHLPLLPQQLTNKPWGNGAGRGQFAVCNFTVTNSPATPIDTAHGPVQLVIADGKRDPWLQGRDSIAGAESSNHGNYGAFYRIRLWRSSGDGRGLAVVLCRLAANSRYCGHLAAVMQTSRGEWPAATVALPARGTSFGGSDEAALVQCFPPLPKGRKELIELLYSPPGAACLPTPILFVPYE